MVTVMGVGLGLLLLYLVLKNVPANPINFPQVSAS